MIDFALDLGEFLGQDLRSEILPSNDVTFSGILIGSYCNLRTEGESYKSQYAFIKSYLMTCF